MDLLELVVDSLNNFSDDVVLVDEEEEESLEEAVVREESVRRHVLEDHSGEPPEELGLAEHVLVRFG